MASRFGQSSIGVSTTSHLTLSKYVDLVNFSAILPYGRSWQVLAVLLAGTLWAVLSLFRVWWKASASGRQAIRLAWAATLTWTLLLNAYVPIYDSILVVLSVLITAGVLNDAHQETSRRVLGFLWPLIYVASWFTIGLAESWHVQLLTLLLAALGVLQLRILRKTLQATSISSSENLRLPRDGK